jgi:outer membrane lipoprotein LolB
MKLPPLRKCSYFRERLNIVCFIATTLFTSACVTVEQHPQAPGSEISKQAAWKVHQANIQSLANWKLKGRVAGKSNNQGFRAGVQWHQFQSNYVIDLHGPLGRKVAVLSGMKGSVQLKTSKGERFEADNAESLMQELFGYALPVNGLRYWLLGIPDPSYSQNSFTLDEQGRLRQLDQAGWLIKYTSYHEGNPVLPALIQISNTTVDANIKVDRWTTHIKEN